MFGMKFSYTPDRSRQEAVMEKIRERIRREAFEALEINQKKKEKKNGS
tara:strand:- start:43 stop:186 length:144 start_codon:yes stop_codon:yes gene_type:complete